MSDRHSPGKGLTPEEKLAQFRANSKALTSPVEKRPAIPKPALNLNPPAPGGVPSRLPPLNTAAELRYTALQAKAAPQRPSAAFKQVATPVPKKSVVKAGALQKTVPSSIHTENNVSLRAKRDFAKAVAQRPTAPFNRAARINKTISR